MSFSTFFSHEKNIFFQTVTQDNSIRAREIRNYFKKFPKSLIHKRDLDPDPDPH
jgi:hypothetical protein